MDTQFLQRIRASRLEQRHNLTDWLSTTPAQERQLRLGPADEGAVEALLQVLNTAIERAEDQTLGLCQVCHDYSSPIS